jgi:hypothetical protein
LGRSASLIETTKLNAVDPQAYLATTLTRLVNRHPANQIVDTGVIFPRSAV